METEFSIHHLLLRVLAASSIFAVPLTAQAIPWQENTPSLEISDQVVLVQSGDANVFLSIQAKPNSYFKVGRSLNTNIFSRDDDELTLAEGADIVASGRLSKEGRLVL